MIEFHNFLGYVKAPVSSPRERHGVNPSGTGSPDHLTPSVSIIRVQHSDVPVQVAICGVSILLYRLLIVLIADE